MIQFFDMVGSGANALYRLENTQEVPLSVEVAVMKRTYNEQGEEVLVPAEEDFLIMPPQARVEPGAFQAFRARYMGDGSAEKTESYRIIFSQLPVEQENEASSVELLFNFATLAFVAPPGVVAQPQVEVSASGNEVLITNQGDDVLDMSRWNLDMKSTGGSERVGWSVLQDFSSAQFVMPGHTLALPVSDSWSTLATPLESAELLPLK
ncbi:fimbrial biogenesis chaperone [Ferrimonas marina]|nr:fimbria/pilus periplasmic chaperone [Ferrimonas marina]